MSPFAHSLLVTVFLLAAFVIEMVQLCKWILRKNNLEHQRQTSEQDQLLVQQNNIPTSEKLLLGAAQKRSRD